MATEFGWLIENGKKPGDGLAYRFINNDLGGIPDWTEDPNKAQIWHQLTKCGFCKKARLTK